MPIMEAAIVIPLMASSEGGDEAVAHADIEGEVLPWLVSADDAEYPCRGFGQLHNILRSRRLAGDAVAAIFIRELLTYARDGDIALIVLGHAECLTFLGQHPNHLIALQLQLKILCPRGSSQGLKSSFTRSAPKMAKRRED